MPYYRCRLAVENGKVFSRTFFASSPQSCKNHFESQGYCILSIKRDWKKTRIFLLSGDKKALEKGFLSFNQELVALLKAGYTVLKSLEIIISRIKNSKLKEILILVKDEIKKGSSLSQAFVNHQKYFSTVYIASLMAGERGGNLPETLSRYIRYKKVILKTKTRIKSALMYPSLLIVFSFILLAILVNFIIPRFSDLYMDFGAELPLITQFLIGFSMMVQRFFYIFIILGVVLVIVYIQMKKENKTQMWLDRLKLYIPFGKKIWKESSISLFCRTLSLLLSGGITLVHSVEIANTSVPNRFLTHKLKDTPDYIKNGESLSFSLSQSSFFSPLALDMIRIGETSANLEGMLYDVADLYDDRVQEKIDRFVSLIEPAIIIFMGVVVAGMLLSVYLPIFNIIRVAG